MCLLSMCMAHFVKLLCVQLFPGFKPKPDKIQEYGLAVQCHIGSGTFYLINALSKFTYKPYPVDMGAHH